MNLTYLQQILAFTKCSACQTIEWQIENNQPICKKCGHKIPISGNSLYLMPHEVSEEKKKIQNFWGDLCQQWYSQEDATLTVDSLENALKELEQLFIYREHLATTEMPYKNLNGLQVLEIGSGGGGHSALFKSFGANMVSLDITPERVASTTKKLDLVRNGQGIAVQGDAENLPFADNSFDIVYSNGVLHHSSNTDRCVQEVFRVLKPKGKAVIMLYSRHSVYYWLHLLPLGILKGLFFRYPEPYYLGIITEGKPKFKTQPNPITRIYSKRQMQDLFSRFSIKSLRKNSFILHHLPFGSFFYPLFQKFFGQKVWKVGSLLYGSAWVSEFEWEKRMAKYWGFAWSIVAEKP